MNSRKFDQLKLAAIKEFLSNHNDRLGAKLTQSITEAKSVGSIWCLLFENKLFDLYSKLRAEGISPSAAEMNEKNEDQSLLNAWFTLLSSNEGKAEFQRLIQQGILPDTQALAERRSSDNTSGWYRLAKLNKPLLLLLIQKNILPTSAALSEQRTANNTNGWFELCDKESIDVFKALIQRDILPSVEALSALRKSDNTSGFYWLTASNEGIVVLLQLIERNILPTVEALSVPGKIDNTNGFYWLTTSDDGAEVLLQLKKNGILPTSAAFSELRTDNTSGWFWLLGSPKRRMILGDLIKNGISPDSATLVKRYKKDNTSFWHWLLRSQIGLETALLLTNKGLWPDSQTLAEFNSEDQTCGWYWLLSQKVGDDAMRVSLAHRLIQKGILPNQELLAKELSKDESSKSLRARAYAGRIGWSLLLKHKNISILQALLNLDIVPSVSSIDKNKFKELKEKNEKSDVNDPVRKVIARLDRIVELNTKYSIGYSELDGKMAAFLTRDDLMEFYGFFYLFYLTTAKGRIQIGDFYITKDTLFEIGKHLLALPELQKFEKLNNPENRFAFAKYHLLQSLDNRKPNLFSFFNRKENERLASFKEEIKGTCSLTEFTKVVTAQYYMAEHPLTYVKKSTEYKPDKKPPTLHHASFKSKASDDVVSLLRATSALVLK